MLYQVLAELVLGLHLAFILFIAIGGLIVWRRPALAPVHLTAVAWGAIANIAGWVCPLTPLENAFRAAAGQSGYAGSFLEHYLSSVVYPEGWPPWAFVAVGLLALGWNALVYGAMLLRYRSRRSTAESLR